MQNDENEVIDTPIEEVEEVVETPIEGEGQPEKDWKAEALKFKAIAERRAKQANRTLPTKKEDIDDITPLRQDVADLKLERIKRNFGYENNLSPDETDMIFKFNQKPTKDDLNNPFVKGGLDAIRAAKRVADNTPSPSNSAPTFNGKTFKELTPEEKQKNWADQVRARARK